ncbi:conserved hypothetical protein [Talaromyces stipitatus ATCC 10500]|uniref:Endoplasmic reticulum-based factor for assembly of V-ATPase n=1 Tax=Talaromyces stipitatus (strain ATCC 10500 / CBS 375.48 / QM 6759 / NRRL 1006) TaxID=441959 RepID=B8M6Y8_TALSN|nr:uncharacterized protein TSTA_034470 [Talaromyces stipitatus ATCC 10500]EED20208.1 conserved hypothetical protein [Talaromyces stipitatus ATCC 10500]
MVLLTTTQTIITALQDLSPSARTELHLPEPIPSTGAPISHKQLISLSKAFTTDSDSLNANNEYTLNSLLRGTKVYIPPPPAKPEPSPEYLALKARLQALADEQAYNALIAPSSVHTTYKPSPIFSGIPSTDTIDKAEEDDMITPSLVINIFMSVLLCGFATFWALKNFQTPSFLSWILLSSPSGKKTTSTAASKDPVFVLVSMFVGILVGVAETVVYAAYLRKVKYAKETEKRIKETKEVVSSEVLDESKHDDHGKEEVKIWGKGVNGGVRRRVRERWENANEDSRPECQQN